MQPGVVSGLGENAGMHPHSTADTASAARPLADPHKASADVPLAPDENVLSRLEVDLDARLCFQASALVLTDQRLMSRSGAQVKPNAGNVTQSDGWQVWPLDPGLSLRHHDHAGVGTLELHDATQRLATWRFTLTVHAQVMRLVEGFQYADSHAGEGCPANWKPGKETIEANPDGSKSFFKAMAGTYGKD